MLQGSNFIANEEKYKKEAMIRIVQVLLKGFVLLFPKNENGEERKIIFKGCDLMNNLNKRKILLGRRKNSVQLKASSSSIGHEILL